MTLPVGKPLPVAAALDDLAVTLGRGAAAVLVAPPGAGKTTLVPPALLDAGLCGRGEVWVLQPRRLAARAVATHMARARGESVGQTVGYRVRMDQRVSAKTRIVVVTDGVLVRRFLDDPLLEGVGCLVLDEVHERSAHGDLALGFARELVELRDDLKLVAMSATLDAGELSKYLNNCNVLDVDARAMPLRIEHAREEIARPVAQRVRAALGRLMTETDDDGGDLLVFLPGAGAIQAAQRQLELEPLPGDPLLVPLFGGLSLERQDRALAAGPRRRVVLATNIAETSLTVPGVTAVVDSGRCKRVSHDPRTGLDRLAEGWISRDSATQRAGRAGRLAPGRVVRLYTEQRLASLIPHEVPEVGRVDLTPVALRLMAYHPHDPAEFPLLRRLSAGRSAAAVELLRRLGAVRSAGFQLTDLGRRLARLPLHPRLGAIVLAAASSGATADAALACALLSEREVLRREGGRPADLPNGPCDLEQRADRIRRWQSRGTDGSTARSLGLDPPAARRVARTARQLVALANNGKKSSKTKGYIRSGRCAGAHSLGPVLLRGFPDRVCRRRSPGAAEAVMVGGRGVSLARESGVREQRLFLALLAGDHGAGTHACSRVTLASGITAQQLERAFPAAVRSAVHLRWDPTRDRVEATKQRLFFDLPLSERPVEDADPGRVADLLAREAGRRFNEVFQPDRAARQLQGRVALAAELNPGLDWPDLSEPGMRRMLPELCHGRWSLAQLNGLDWADPFNARLHGGHRRWLNSQLPEKIKVPSGRFVAIDYTPVKPTDAADVSRRVQNEVPGVSGTVSGVSGKPILAVKLQELFGLAETPAVAGGRVPLLLHLLAPNGRPVQITSDLRNFWNNTYTQVRKDMRGRYPKHPWPDDPWAAAATHRTKKRKK